MAETGASKELKSSLVEVVKMFESLIRRNIAPSLGFFAFVAVADLVIVFFVSGTDPLSRVGIWLQRLSTEQTTILIFLFLLALTGLSYVLAALHQVLYDDWLRADFDAWPPKLKKKENDILEKLRGKVRDRLGERKPPNKLDECILANDYLLSQVLIQQVPSDTRRYVDRAKAIGITAISAGLVLLLLAAGLGWWLLVIPALFVLWAGFEAVKGRYRSRAIRLYIHFLTMPQDQSQTANSPN